MLQCGLETDGEMRCSSASENGSHCDYLSGPIRIGLALQSKKVKRYATPHVLRRARKAGAEVIRIDTGKSLSEQGPFNVIIHKLVPTDPFYAELESYVQAHPQTRVIDEVKQVRSLQTRSDMLRAFYDNPLSTFRPDRAEPSIEASNLTARESFYADGATSSSPVGGSLVPGVSGHASVCTFSAPKQIVCPSNTSLEDICTKLSAAGVQFPVISKPIVSDGTDGSHSLTLFLSLQALQALVDPETNTTSEGVVLQQFEEHGGVLFKVYVLGGLCEVMLRPSLQLPEESREKLHSCRSGWIVLPRFSTTPIVDQEPATYVPEPSSYGAESSRVGLERDNSGTRGSSPGCSDDGLPARSGALLGSSAHEDSSILSSSDAENSHGELEPPHQSSPPHWSSSWPQLKELGKELSQEKARVVRAPNGLARISWMARTGSGRDLGFSVQDPGDLVTPDTDQTGDAVCADVAALQPPDWSLPQLAKQLQKAIGLTMFNLDVICPLQQPKNGEVNYRVVDINYFPGFDKLPSFEDKFADFLVACGQEAVAKAAKQQPCSSEMVA